MKNTTHVLAGMLLCGIVNAGEPATAPIGVQSAAPAAAASLSDWFIGATYGEMDQLDEFYAFQVGRDFSNTLAAYLEVGSTSEDTSIGDLDFIPVTLNLKLEGPIAGGLNWYLTGGIGAAFWDVSTIYGDDDGTSFYTQATTGLLYNINQNIEIFGGLRWIYLDEADSDDYGFEGGLRYNF